MRCELDTVLGLSMTPSAVGLVLVEGENADGEIMAQDGFDIPTRRGVAAISTSAYVAGAMSRTGAMANDHRPYAIGVTWSEESELEASLLLKSLTDAGFDNIVAVRSPEAGEALARGIGRVAGYPQTAVCLLEPETVVVSMVDTHDGTVQTVSHHEHDTDLIDWLIRVFDVNDWRPGCLVVVGPDADLASLTKQLEAALHLPVFAPPEADLALARGAALASAHNPELTFDEFHPADRGEPERRRSFPLPYTAALTMLAVGVVAFVVSIAFAAGLRLTSENGSDAATPVQRPTATQPASRSDAKPPLLTRILGHIPGLHDDPTPPSTPPAP